MKSEYEKSRYLQTASYRESPHISSRRENTAPIHFNNSKKPDGDQQINNECRKTPIKHQKMVKNRHHQTSPDTTRYHRTPPDTKPDTTGHHRTPPDTTGHRHQPITEELTNNNQSGGGTSEQWPPDSI